MKQKITIELEELFKNKYPRRRKETLKKVVSNVKSRVNNWTKKYGVNKEWCFNIIKHIISNNERCNYCSEELTFENISLDRKIPEIVGGSNDVDNLQFICKKCNRRKGQLTDTEYKQLLNCINNFSENSKKYVLRKLSHSDF